MNDPEAMLERWNALAGDTSPRPWTPDQMAGFFQCFRPDGQGPSQAFEGVLCGDGILARLLEIYRATADGWRREETHDGYFIARNPPPTTAGRAEDLIRQHLGRVAAMAKAIGQAELTSLLRQPLRIELAEGEAPSPSPDYDAPESLNLNAAVCLYVAHHNYVRRPAGLRVSPAMAAGVTDRLWRLEDLYDAVA